MVVMGSCLLLFAALRKKNIIKKAKRKFDNELSTVLLQNGLSKIDIYAMINEFPLACFPVILAGPLQRIAFSGSVAAPYRISANDSQGRSLLFFAQQGDDYFKYCSLDCGSRALNILF